MFSIMDFNIFCALFMSLFSWFILSLCYKTKLLSLFQHIEHLSFYHGQLYFCQLHWELSEEQTGQLTSRVLI